MKNTQNKKAFSFVEIIIVLAVIVLLAVVALNANTSYKEKANTVKVEADSKTLKSSFEEYLAENNSLPMPGGNNNFFKDDGSYGHTGSTTNFGVHGYVTADTLPNKYINYLPLDPKTNQFYAYGKTLTGATQFEIASVVWKNALPETKLEGNYPGEDGPISLIREYNGPNFVSDKSKTSFPYNPEELLLTAKVNSYSGSVTINGSNLNIENTTLVSGDEIVVPAAGYAELYFSDGSSSVLGDSTNESKLVLADMAYKSENNLITKIKLALSAGTLWTNATSLNDESEFDVFTADASAAVRGTVFGVKKVYPNTTNITVEVGKVKVEKVNLNPGIDLDQAILKSEFTTGVITDTSLSTIIDSVTDDLGKIESFINVEEGGDAKGIDVKTDTTEENQINKTDIDSSSLTNVKLKLKSITQSGTTDTVITFKNRPAFSGAYMLVGNSDDDDDEADDDDDHNCRSSDSDFICTTNQTGTQDVRLCKDMILGTETKQSCTQSIKVDLELEAENTPESLSGEIENGLDGVYKQAERNCVDFTMNGTTECIKNNLGDEWEIVGYAPYNESMNFDMYQNDELNPITPVTPDYNKDALSHAESMKSLESDGFKRTSDTNFYTKDNIKGILLDNQGSDNSAIDYLRYNLSNLELGNSFAIEMSVRGAALKRSSGTFYLFNNSDIYLDLYNGSLLLGYTDYNNVKKVNPIPTLDSNSFYKVIATFDGTNWDLIIVKPDNFIINSIDGPEAGININLPDIYIGSKNDKTSQWNDIIDYVKIYKED